MNARLLFESSLSTIEGIISTVCRRARLRGADAEDFASSVKIALLEDDCAILRKHQGRSSLAAYLSVVIDRMHSDDRIRAMGRFYSSAEALKMGPPAVLLETLLHRDRRSLEEALPIVRASYPEITRAEAERIAGKLPERTPRPRLIHIDDADVPLAAPDRPDETALAGEQRKLSERTARVLRETLERFPLEDRTLVRLHYGSSISIADVSRMMRVPQRPLYRRLERALAAFRDALAGAGIDARSIPALLSGALADELDFGLRDHGAEHERHARGSGP